MNANSHPIKTVSVADEGFYANNHPYKVVVEGGPGGNIGKVVDTLPEVGEPGFIYLVLKETTSEGDIYDEYLWAQQSGESFAWEHLGATNQVAIQLYSTYGQNTDGAMTQKATTDLVYTAGDPKKINIGDNGATGATNSIIIGSEDSGTITGRADQIIIGHNITDKYSDTVVIGHNTVAGGQHSVVVGQGSVSAGESVAIGYFAASNQAGIGIGKSAAAGDTSVVIGPQQFITMAFSQRFIGIGGYLENSNDNSVAIGYGSGTVNKYSVALGYAAYTRDQGVVDVSTSASRYGGNYGYQGVNDQTRTNLRVISGVHDPDQAQDAATKNYVDTQVGNIETILQTLNSGTGV